MLKKAILALGTCLSLFLLWFALYSYRQSIPIAEENLRGLALSLSATIEKLAVQDTSLAELANFHAGDIAYFALIDSHGVFRFHSNSDLIGTSIDDGALPELNKASPSEARVTLGTGERVFQFTTPLYLPKETLVLRLALHTFRADAVIRRAKLNTAILLCLLVAGWVLTAVLIRYARREELHQMEMARRESLARLGEMGAMLAHEIRNPLAGIKGFAQLIAKRPGEPRNSGFAQKIVTETGRLEELVTDLLAYGSTDFAPLAPFDLSSLFEHTVSLLASEALALGVEIVTHCPDRLQVCGNRDKLEQVLLNVGKNALQAMPEGGVVVVTAVLAGDKVVITVQDSGHGISAAELPKVFDPFFTTKARGTGLGLALCKKIVEEHAGTVRLASTPDEGTTVTITLPLQKRGGIRRSS